MSAVPPGPGAPMPTDAASAVPSTAAPVVPAVDPASPPAARRDQLSSNVRKVSGMTLLSRLGGLARDVMLARVFGAGGISSAFMAGFAVPNTFRRLFGEGALTAVFIPAYAKAHQADPREADRLASLVGLLLLAVTGVLTVIIEAALLAVMMGFEHSPTRLLSIQLVMIMLPFMPLICVAATLAGMLQVHGRFGPASSGPLLLNGFIIAAGMYTVVTGQLGDARTAMLLGIATVASGFTQCVWYAWLLRNDVRWSTNFAGLKPAMSKMMQGFVPALIGLGTMQLMTLLDTLVAMWPIWVGPTMMGRVVTLDAASNSLINFAQRLYQFPLGVFGIAVATAIFPMLSRHATEPQAFADTLRRGVRLSLFIGLPASVGLFLVREPLTAVLYSGGGGGLTSDKLARASGVLGGYAPAIWAYSLNHVLTRGFYALGDTKTPMKISIVSLIIGFLAGWLMMWPLAEAGLAWGGCLAAIIQCGLLGVLLARRTGMRSAAEASIHDPAFTRDPLPLRAPIIKLLLSMAVMGGAVFVLLEALPANGTWMRELMRLGLAVGVGGVVYGVATLGQRCQEFQWLLGRSR